MSVRVRLALILGVVLLPLLLGTALVLGVVVPARLADQTGARLRIVAGAVSSLQVQSCIGAGDSARLMALAVAKGEPARVALSGALTRRPGYGSILRGAVEVVRSPTAPSGAPLNVVPAKGCSAPMIAASPPWVVPASTAGLPFLTDSVTVAGQAPSLTAVVTTALDRYRLGGWLKDIGVSTNLDVAVACPEGTSASTAWGQRDGQLRGLALSRLAGGRADLSGDSIEASAAGTGHPCVVVVAAPERDGAAAPWLLFTLLGFALAVGAPLIWWLARQLSRPVLAVTDAAEQAARGDHVGRLPDVRSDEVGRLAQTFNTMAVELDQRSSEIQHGRDQLTDNVQRLGDALQRTHDLDGLLATVCAISASTTDSIRATAWLVEGSSLVARVSWPADSRRSSPGRVPMEGTLLGQVVSTGVPAWMDAEDQSASLGGPALCAPLLRGSDTLGAVVVERGPGSATYGKKSGAALVSITGPASIAMDNALLHRQAQRHSVHDPLTGVGNLRMLTTTLAREVERARYFQRCCSLLILDIDHFGELNKMHGHGVGDQILAGVAARITASVRSVDSVARYGGEEFAVVCPELDPVSAMAVAEAVWHAVRDTPFDIDGTPIDVHVSVGVASWPQQAGTSVELLRAADAAVSRAKDLGRDQVAQS